jgi:hypothetical protein
VAQGEGEKAKTIWFKNEGPRTHAASSGNLSFCDLGAAALETLCHIVRQQGPLHRIFRAALNTSNGNVVVFTTAIGTWFHMQTAAA